MAEDLVGGSRYCLYLDERVGDFWQVINEPNFHALQFRIKDEKMRTQGPGRTLERVRLYADEEDKELRVVTGRDSPVYNILVGKRWEGIPKQIERDGIVSVAHEPVRTSDQLVAGLDSLKGILERLDKNQ